MKGTNELSPDPNTACSIFLGGYYYFWLSTPWCVLKFHVFHVGISQASRSNIVLVFRSALLSILSLLVLSPKGLASSYFGNKCLCVEQISLIDCSRAGLISTPQTKKRMTNYTTLSLRDNLLLEVNFTLLMEQFPDLQTVDVRNNPIYCEGLNAGGPLIVITDCKTLKPTTHHRISTKIISSTTESFLVRNLTQSFNINSTTSDFTDPEIPSTVYLTTLTASIISIPFILLCLRVVIKLLLTRLRRQRNVIGRSFEMISFNPLTTQTSKLSLTLLHCKDCLLIF